MKYGDSVKVITQKEEYINKGINKGMIGTIWLPEIRDESFYVAFETDDTWDAYKYCDIKIKDLQLEADDGCSDLLILEALPKNNPLWWCKVEDGYIKNLNGDKKNKIPYDYES